MSSRTLMLSALAVVAGTSIAPDVMANTKILQSIVPEIEMPALDYDWLAVDDDTRALDHEPFRFAVPNEAFITPGNNGLWDRDAQGRLRWRMQIEALGAPHINLAFEHWDMPASGTLTIQSSDGSSLVGPFNSTDGAEGELWVPPVHGDQIIITITCDDADQLRIEEQIAITKINVGYRGFGLFGNRGTSESCNIDVACSEGDDWRNEIPSAAVYTLQGYLTCSGAMINNTDQDQTPYFLTADHCGIGTNNDQTMVVIWNYENSYCRVPGSSDSGGNGNGSTNQYTSGALFLTGSSQTDFTLVRLNSSPSNSYEISFSGWNRSSGTPSIGASIHHPECAEKRISFPDSVYSSGGGGLSLWGVNWGEGRTAPGSSGSPLYNANHQIVGQLCCGSSYCTNDLDDYYGRSLSGSWSLLSPYLDPSGSGVASLNTYNPYGSENPSGACCFNGSCIFSNESTCADAGGIFYEGIPCSGANCSNDPTGACCTGTSCSVQTEADCSGDYLGDGSDCSGDPCAAPTGACCYNTSCAVSTEANCGGVYLGDGSSCAGNPCDNGSGDDALLGLSYSIVGSNLVDDAEATWTVDVYAHLADDCRLDAVAGDANQDKMVSTTGSFFQHIYGGATSQSINPALFSAFPDLRYDSFVSIGRTDQTDNAMSDIGIDFSAFESGGAIDSSDGSWYITPVDDQGEAADYSDQLCEDAQGVLVARLTVRGANASVYVEALFQGKDESGTTWQSSGALSIVNDDCNVQCTGDYDGDGMTNVSDLLAVIAGWGTYNVEDLLTVIADWNCGAP